ncbi:Aromatic amino acid lyase [Kalmanozyma brasiliensis GHG001]|uniref:Putative phenylalanine ammonia-lyase n=1 Tax=Kalmanozyma brasiliensis (strain GHG001) TaxID=1365824 RepID=V5F0A6_KALBG|nr:Aromatic amino acid lyase [Kalmanozyma brasiliensis GHG001]EST09713.1 Aromatic amino acid lyase [Kalmanozyma brasiliensis GHG001]
MAPTADVLPAPAEPSTRPNLLVQPSDTKVRKASSFRTDQVIIDGYNLKIQGLVASARYGHVPILDPSAATRKRIDDSVQSLVAKLNRGESIYGINTGFGGSADSRTANTRALQLALLQMQQCGVLPVPSSFPTGEPSSAPFALPLTDTESSLIMPEAWVRGAIVVRLSSLMRGHSGVRWEVLDKMQKLFLENNVTPVVPVRSSISASGDLSPLSYVAGALAGQRGIYCFVTDKSGQRIRVTSDEACRMHNITPVQYEPKEALGLLNGTAFSASVAGLATYEADRLATLTQLTTAMAVEALKGTDASFAPFIHEIARPHPGQVQSAKLIRSLLSGSKLAEHLEDEKHVLFSEDNGTLRQDRYTLRTASQWVGPGLEDIENAKRSVDIEINSTTDNPMIDPYDGEGRMHHGGNFQAQQMTNAVEKIRLALCAMGKMTFQQMTELVNPAMNRGLPANLASTPDPSLNFHAKGIDIALAAVTSELMFLGNPVSTHVQCAEMGNQAINSLALISGRQTLQAVECLSMIQAWSLYLLCQALDIRALQHKVAEQLPALILASLHSHFNEWMDEAMQQQIAVLVLKQLSKRLDETSSKDLRDRLIETFQDASSVLVKYFSELPSGGGADPLRNIVKWRAAGVLGTEKIYRDVTVEFLDNPYACHASHLLGKTKRAYEFVRKTLGVPMHGKENLNEFKGEFEQWNTTGGYVSVIYASIRDGELYNMLSELEKDL